MFAYVVADIKSARAFVVLLRSLQIVSFMLRIVHAVTTGAASLPGDSAAAENATGECRPASGCITGKHLCCPPYFIPYAMFSVFCRLASYIICSCITFHVHDHCPL